MIWDPYHITWDPNYIFETFLVVIMIITTVIFLAITINKISFFPVCENIQTSEDGDGELVILWYFLFKPVKTRRVPHHSHQSLKGSEGARLQKVNHCQSFSMLFIVARFFTVFHADQTVETWCWWWCSCSFDPDFPMIHISVFVFAEPAWICEGWGGYQNKVYTSVARESVRSSYKVWYVTLVCTFFW